MHPDLPSFGALAALSVREPRRAARLLLATGVPMQVRWLVLGIVIAVSSVLLNLELRMTAPELRDAVAPFVDRPVLLAVLQAAMLLVFILLVHRVGTVAGGQGGFADALLLVGWLQLLLLCLSVAQFVLLLALPALANILGLVGLGLFLWLLVNFVAELHGFPSLPKVALGIAATFLLAGFALATLLAPFLPAPTTGG